MLPFQISNKFRLQRSDFIILKFTYKESLTFLEIYQILPYLGMVRFNIFTIHQSITDDELSQNKKMMHQKVIFPDSVN